MSTRELYNLIEHFDRRFDRIEQLLEQLLNADGVEALKRGYVNADGLINVDALRRFLNADGSPPQQPVPDEPFMHKRGWGSSKRGWGCF